MKKKRRVLNSTLIKLSFLVGLILTGCNSEVNKECFKVRIGINYCGVPNTVQVFFEESNKFSTTQDNDLGDPIHHIAAITDFPESLTHIDSVFYVHFHYDKEREKQFREDSQSCSSFFIPVKILTFDGVSTESCKPLENR